MASYQGITATAYYNTQFNSINLPKNVSVLTASAVRTKAFPAMEINQLYFLDKIRVKVEGEADVMGVDYLKLSRVSTFDLPDGFHGEVFYSVQSYVMTSYDVAELYVTMDSWLTAGGLDGISDCLDGIAIRASLPTYGINTIEDPMLIPHFPILAFVGSGGEINDGLMLDQQSNTSVIVSTIDLKWLDDQANQPQNVISFFKEIVHEQGTGTQTQTTAGVLSKALIKCMAVGAACKLYTGTGIYGDSSQAEVDNGSSDLRYFYADSVRNGLDFLRSFGIESSVIKSYKLPKCQITDDADSEHVVGQRIFRIEADTTEYGHSTTAAGEYKIDYTSSQGYREAIRDIPLQHSPKYIKTLLGRYNKYVIGSPATGNTRSVLPEELDIIDLTNPNFRDAGPVVYVLSDPRPDGRAYFNIRTKDSKYIFDNGVAGAGWLENPIVYKDPSGEFLNQMAFESQQEYKDMTASADYYRKYNQTPIENKVNNIKKIPINIGRGIYNFGADIADSMLAARGISPSGNRISPDESYAKWNIPGYRSQQTRAIEAGYERQQFMISNATYVPEVRFASSGSLANVTGNGVMLVKFGLDPRDIAMFDRIQEQFGIATSEPLTKTMLDPGNKDFAYVEAKGVSFKFNRKDVTKDMENDINMMFNNGVRIWTKSPNVASYNPYRED